MKPFFFLALFAVFFPFVSHAATSGDLIKGSGSSVYYLGQDGKRYAFPTEPTYFTWYTDFSGVQTVSDPTLASYFLGGNVTIRPGTKLVKITTNPKVYAVAKGGLLRWVQTESVASALFGTDWAHQVLDIPDTFFINYRIGTPIASASDYDRTAEMSGSATINLDKGLVAPQTTTTTAPTPTSTTTTVDRSVYLTFSPTTPHAGETLTLQATASTNASVALAFLKLYYDGVVYRTCSSSPCTADIVLPGSNTAPSYEVRAEASWIDNVQRNATSTVTMGSGAAGVSLTITRPELTPGSTMEIIMDVNGSFVAKYIDIYVDGGNIKGCNNVQQCRYAGTVAGSVGTVHSVYGIATDANGMTRRTETKTVSVVTNPHPIVTIQTGKSLIYRGETVDVSVDVIDDDGVTSTDIWANGVLLKQCATNRCTMVTGPWNSAGTLTFVGKATDALGLESSVSSSAVLIQ